MGSRLNFGRSLDFEGSVAAGGNPKVWIDGGATIEELHLATNLEPGEFTLLVWVDGDKRVEITGQQMLDREAYDGRPATSGEFALAFADAVAKTAQGEAMTGLTTQAGQRVLVELEIADTVTPVTPEATLYTETSGNRPEEVRLYILPEAVPITKIGENQFAGFRRGTRMGQNYIRRVFNYGAVSKLSIEQDRRTVFGKRELPKTVNDARLKRNGKTPPTACYVFDPILKGNVVIDMLDTFSREFLRFTYTTTDANDLTALTEYVQDLRERQAAAA